MPLDRNALRATAVTERRPPVALIQRSAAPAARSPAHAQQDSVGIHATEALVARATADFSPKATRLPAKVSKPTEPAELEAEEMARKVTRVTSSPAVTSGPGKEPSKGILQRAEAPAPPAAPARTASRRSSGSGGSPLPPPVRSSMEGSFGADFGGVRVHTDSAAASQSAAIGARAFTVGGDIFFARGAFQPQSAGGRELIAHELTHTIQQGAAVQRAVDHTVAIRSEPRVQRLGISDALDWIADKANYIPGFRLLTIVLGMNPVNWAPVERSAANILRALLELIPVTGTLLAQALEANGIFVKVGAWVEVQVRSLGVAGGALKGALDKFLNTLSWRDIFDLGDVWERGKRIFTEPVDRLLAFGKTLVTDILGFIRQAVLLPLARLAEGTRGYDLLKAVLGEDPVTGQPVARNAETLIGGFMKLIGQEEVWENLKKANAVPRAWAWFQGALAGLLGYVRQVPALFTAAFKALELADLILVPRAFAKIAGVFGGFVVEFLKWAGNTVWTLLEIIFEVVSPATLGYLKRTGAALYGILKNPLPFVRNLVRAAKLGFQNFADNFGTHLKAGLIDWLIGALPGVYIPKAFSLGEIVKFVFSVLGLSWANIRGKLVKVVGETTVKAMEVGFDIVVTLVTQGPAAAWEKIQEQLANLKDMVIDGITGFVVDTVVKKAVPKLIAMFIPGAGFISAIISIYDTIMVFVDKLSKIVQLVTGFIDSIVAIANGQIDAAAKKVESSLANVLSLAISFLAGFLGLGNVAEKIMGVIMKIRGTVDKAIDALIAWIVKMAKSLFAKAKAAVGKALAWAFATSTFKDADGKQHTVSVSEKGVLTIESTPQAAREFVAWYVKEKGIDAAKAEPIYDLIKKADALVDKIEKSKKKVDDVPAPEKQKELLGLSNQISELISKLVGRDPGDLEKKYLLEGQVGTYATIPKPVGDQLTPDHQPQASVILAAADFFKKALGIKGGDLAARAEGRAAQGFAINLHFRRHVAGATYGSKGKKDREAFRNDLTQAAKDIKKGDLDKDDAKTLVVTMLKDAVKADVAAMKDVAGKPISDPAWTQLKEEVKDDKKAEKLKEEIGKRIVAGENQIASQPFDF